MDELYYILGYLEAMRNRGEYLATRFNSYEMKEKTISELEYLKKLFANSEVLNSSDFKAHLEMDFEYLFPNEYENLSILGKPKVIECSLDHALVCYNTEPHQKNKIILVSEPFRISYLYSINKQMKFIKDLHNRIEGPLKDYINSADFLWYTKSFSTNNPSGLFESYREALPKFDGVITKKWTHDQTNKLEITPIQDIMKSLSEKQHDYTSDDDLIDWEKETMRALRDGNGDLLGL